MNSLFLDTYKWHDKTYGNSYFASRVSINGALAFALPFQYGYERMDEEILRQELVKRGLINDDGTSLRNQIEAQGCDYYRSTQWTRQSEAKQHGQLMDFMIGAGF